MKKEYKMIKIGAFVLGLFLIFPMFQVNAAPPIQTDEVSNEEKESEVDKEETKEEEKLRKEKEEKKLTKTLGQMRKRVQRAEKKLRVRANLFTTNQEITDCTGADKARSRLSDIGDEGGLVIKGKLNIQASNEANIEKNEGSIVNETSVNIVNEYYKRC
ncbi:MAG: hypothetical protein GXO96_11460 [Nitrospirae bacterium]|nr:hypothetical protein [Candidatus Manganitrophaceae bacterium]